MPIPRKILIRLVGAPLLLLALGGILLYDFRCRTQTGLRLLLVGVSALGAQEFFAMCARRGIETASLVATLGLVLLFVPGVPGGPGGEGRPPGPIGIPFPSPWALGVLLALVLYVLGKLVFRHDRFTPEGAGLTVLGFAYLGLLGFLLAGPGPEKVHLSYLLFLLAAGKGSDMAAFLVGKAAGRHPMAPVVSPHKTWEGGIAGLGVGTAAGLAVLLLSPLRGAYPNVPWAALLFLALGVTMAAQVGDLVKSAFKRWAGVKDSGRLLPEFGGMLDMVDSFLLAAPVAYVASRVLDRLFG
jgi:phosphatidate cytidylyltransferase